MAIQIDWYENPKPSEQQGEEKTLHPRLRLNGKVTTAQLRARIQNYCTLTETDVSAVLDALSHIMGEELADGKQVHLDGIGFFRPRVVSTEPVTENTKRKSTKVKLKGIIYKADQTLMNEVGNVKVQHTKFTFHSEKLTEEEIDRLLTEHFTTHEFLQRKSFQYLCGMTQSTASRHLRRLCEEGKLKNAGLPKQPIYMPVNGYYTDNKKDNVKTQDDTL